MSNSFVIKNRHLSTYLKWFIMVVLIGYTYYPTFVWMVDRWSARDSYFAHGFIIPLVSLYWIYQKRKVLPFLKTKVEPAGFMILFMAAMVQVFSSLFRIYFISAFSFVFLLFGVIYFLYGKEAVKHLWFPIAFLFLMIPLPLLFISQVTLKMKFFVSEVATHLLHTIRVSAVRQGSYILTKNSVCLVGDPCSGLRSFLAFLCLGLVFAYSDKLALWKKAVLVVSGFPLAIISNVFRVFAMSLLGEIYGTKLIETKTVHDGMGILVFIIALVCFIALRKKLETLHVSAR